MKFFPALLVLALSSPALAADPHADMSSKSAPAKKLTQQASVLSVQNVPPYSYIEVSQNKQTRWLASTAPGVKKGDVIRFDDGMIMTNFYSKSLKRTFPSIAFVNQVEVETGKK